MGARSNIAIKYSTGDAVYLYGHWLGEENQKIVEDALIHSSRVDDEAYFTRVLFCKMLGDNLQDWRGETGYGISPYMVDNEYPIVWVDYTQRDSKGWPKVYNEAH